MDGVIRITVFDPTVEDSLVPVSQEKYDALVDKYKLDPDHKTSLNKNLFRQLRADLTGHQSHTALGGSGTTTAFTLKRLLPDHIDITFVSAAPDDTKHQWIRDLFRQAGIRYMTKRVHPTLPPEIAESIMILPPSGKRAIATYSGNFGEVLAPYISTSKRDSSILHDKTLNLVSDCDFLHLLLTNIADTRLGENFIKEALGLRWELDKGVIASFPTHKRVAKEYGDTVRDIIPSVEVLAGNWGEAEEIYGNKSKLSNNYHQRGIAAAFALNAPNDLARWKANLGREQVAFITDDVRPMHAITARNVESVYVESVNQPVNTGGAGDSALAGCLAGYFVGLPYIKAAQIGELLGRACVQHLYPCLPNPRQIVEKAPRLYEDLYGLERPWEARMRQQDRRLTA